MTREEVAALRKKLRKEAKDRLYAESPTAYSAKYS